MQTIGLRKNERVALVLRPRRGRINLTSEQIGIARKMAGRGCSVNEIAAAIGWPGHKQSLYHRLRGLGMAMRPVRAAHFRGVDQ
jgi:hypothetical protein